MPVRHAMVGVAVVAVGLLAPAAGADPPERIPLESGPPIVVEGACEFPIEVAVVTNNAVIKIFTSGTEIATGRLVIRVTNISADKSIVLNVSGPGFSRVSADGSATFTLGGRSFFFGNAEMLYPLEGQATLNSGRIVLRFDETGAFLSAQFVGNTQDICAVLA